MAQMSFAWKDDGGLAVCGNLDGTAGKKLYYKDSTFYYDVETWSETGHQIASKQDSLLPLYKEKLVLP